MTDQEFTDSDRLREVAQIRELFVHRFIDRRVLGREKDPTEAEFDAYYAEAHQAWRKSYPALTSLFPSHLPAEVSA